MGTPTHKTTLRFMVATSISSIVDFRTHPTLRRWLLQQKSGGMGATLVPDRPFHKAREQQQLDTTTKAYVSIGNLCPASVYLRHDELLFDLLSRLQQPGAPGADPSLDIFWLAPAFTVMETRRSDPQLALAVHMEWVGELTAFLSDAFTGPALTRPLGRPWTLLLSQVQFAQDELHTFDRMQANFRRHEIAVHVQWADPYTAFVPPGATEAQLLRDYVLLKSNSYLTGFGYHHQKDSLASPTARQTCEFVFFRDFRTQVMEYITSLCRNTSLQAAIQHQLQPQAPEAANTNGPDSAPLANLLPLPTEDSLSVPLRQRGYYADETKRFFDQIHVQYRFPFQHYSGRRPREDNSPQVGDDSTLPQA